MKDVVGTRARPSGWLGPGADVAFPRRARAALLASASFLGAMNAGAQLTQSDGTVIPVTNHLVTFLNGVGETINPLTDAATTPETFKPECKLTFTVIGRGASQKNSFGWYNVTGQKPALAELVEFITCNDGVGTVKVLDIRSDPRYRGGDVGFFEATTEGHTGGFFGTGANCVNFSDPANTLGHVYYSQKGYNEDNNPTGPSYVHLLIMDSKLLKSTFYFGWEDLFKGGDNDFEDLLTRVEGIQCTGGGAACDTGQQGACAVGAMECRNGVLTCVSAQIAQTEKCNAVDDDCNGQVDDGDLCGASEICDRGRCVHRCQGAEFPCTDGFRCRGDGYCVDPRCDSVTCAAGQVCVAGQCRGACDGVVCPFGQACRTGACVDPCAGKECEPGQICDQGVCVSCQCGGCPAGGVCNQAGTACASPDCAAVTCGPGTHCVAGGACADDCAGAACPPGQLCTAGQCSSDPNAAPPDSGAAVSVNPILGSGSGGDAPMLGTAGTTSGAGTNGQSGAGASASAGAPLGCGCRVPVESRQNKMPSMIAWVALALAAARFRRHSG